MRSRSLALAVLLAGLLATAAPASAATFVVTKTSDGTGPCSLDDCPLPEAILAANSNDGDDFVSVPAGAYVLTGAAGEDAAASGDLDVTDASGELVLTGAGAAPGATTISGNNADRVFDVLAGARLELRNPRIVDGNAAVVAASVARSATWTATCGCATRLLSRTTPRGAEAPSTARAPSRRACS